MPSPHLQTLLKHHPHLRTPVIIGAPTRPFALHRVAVAVSQAGGLGFLSSTASDRSELASAASLFSAHPLPSRPSSADARPLLPIGIGYLCWLSSLPSAIADLTAHPVQAVWLYAWTDLSQLREWVEAMHSSFPETSLYIQTCSVSATLEVLSAIDSVPDILGSLVLVVQGADAGGHGATRSAGLMTLLPEVATALRSHGHGYEKVPLLAAGGVIEAHSAAAAMALGAAGVVLGTRLLVAEEMANPTGFKQHVIQASDGGIGTVRTRLFDTMRGTSDFPEYYDGRALINRSLREHGEGVSEAELVNRYKDAEVRFKAEPTANNDEAYGENGRLTSFAGTGVGLVTGIQPAGEIVREVREGMVKRVKELAGEIA